MDDNSKIFKQLYSTVKFKNPYWEYKFDRYSLIDNQVGEYHYVNSRGASMIIPITTEKKIVMVSQFRYLNQRESLEFPGGGVKEGDAYLETARQELQEETGAAAETLLEIGEYNPYNGVTNEITKIFIAHGLQFNSSSPEVTERIDVRLYSLAEFEKLLAEKSIWDGMTLAAWSIFRYSKFYGVLL